MRPPLRVLAALSLFALYAYAGTDEHMERGFDHFYNIEYPEAIASFEKAALADPTSPYPPEAMAQSILYQEMFRNGALDSELVEGSNSFLRRPKLNASAETESRFTAYLNKALELSQRKLAENPNDTESLHVRAVAFALRSNWNFLVRKAWRDALSDATASRKLEDQILTIRPNDPDARLGQGVHEYIVGCLPWTWRTLGFLIGFHGDKAKGLETIEAVARNGKRNKTDAEFMLCALYRRERDFHKALPLLADLIHRYPRNYLLRFEQAKMLSDAGDGKASLAALDEIERLKMAKAPGLVNTPQVKIDFQRATVQFWYRELDGALANFKKVTSSREELDLNTGVYSYMRQGQILDMQHKHSQAIALYGRAINFAPDADAAKECRRYISTPYQRN